MTVEQWKQDAAMAVIAEVLRSGRDKHEAIGFLERRGDLTSQQADWTRAVLAEAEARRS